MPLTFSSSALIVAVSFLFAFTGAPVVIMYLEKMGIKKFEKHQKRTAQWLTFSVLLDLTIFLYIQQLLLFHWHH